jgi:hypothetical protein
MYESTGQEKTAPMMGTAPVPQTMEGGVEAGRVSDGTQTGSVPSEYRPMEGQWKDHCFACFSQMNPTCA